MNENPRFLVELQKDGVQITADQTGYTPREIFIPWSPAGNQAAVLQQVQAKLTDFFYSM